MILVENNNTTFGIDNNIALHKIKGVMVPGLLLDIMVKGNGRARMFLNVQQITLLRDHLSHMLSANESKTDSNPPV